MTREEFQNKLNKGPVFLDGATGTNLMAAGLPSGACPEDWIRKNPEVMIDLQKRYVLAGSDILYAPTFTASRIKLSEYGLENETEAINRAMVDISRQAVKQAREEDPAAADRQILIAGDLTMTGQQLSPLGDLDFEDLVDCYKEQVRLIADAGADLFVVETMMSLQESRAAVLAIKETCDLPVMVTMTFNEDGRTLYGTQPSTAMIVLQSLGADAVGLNCSTGPDAMVPLIKEMRRYAQVPIVCKPNAGLPELEDGRTVYRLTPEHFAEEMEQIIDAGASIVGGCCGTTPEHIRALVERTKDKKILPPSPEVTRVITSERKNQDIIPGGPFLVIGERINPTGKKKLQAELREGRLDLVKEFAQSQEAAGAAVLDVNMGVNGIDEKQMMLDAIEEITYTADLPLCIDSSFPEVIEAALRRYPGRALINSISGEDEKIKAVMPIAKKYGAMFIALPVSSAGLPKTIEEKHANLDRIVEETKKAGMSTDRIVVDLLVATIGADPESALSCFATLDYCKELGLPTVCGLSNISFGLPQRIFINTSFLNIAISRGLTMAIANPSQQMLMYTALAADMLLNKAGATDKYLKDVPSGYIVMTSGKAPKGAPDAAALTAAGQTAADGPAATDAANASQETYSKVTECVLKGDTDHIAAETQKLLDQGMTPQQILNDHLIKGINIVGDYYEQKKYFLPQLISGANAMETAVHILEPLMLSDASDQKETIVIATVEGDIHDIGKNLVALMLKNYGYNVIDLGKNVPADEILDAAEQNDASVIGLSALMTTTMVHMKDVVEGRNRRGLKSYIVIGGACITPSYSDEIGADGYSKDAAECVRLVSRLLGHDQ